MSIMMQRREDEFVEKISKLHEAYPTMPFPTIYKTIPNLSEAYSPYMFRKLLEKHQIIEETPPTPVKKKEKLRIWSRSPKFTHQLTETLRFIRQEQPKSTLLEMVSYLKRDHLESKLKEVCETSLTKMPNITENFLSIFIKKYCKDTIPQRHCESRRKVASGRKTSTSVLRENAAALFTIYEMYQDMGMDKGLLLSTFNNFTKEYEQQFGETVTTYGNFCKWVKDYLFYVECHNKDNNTNLKASEYAQLKSNI